MKAHAIRFALGLAAASCCTSTTFAQASLQAIGPAGSFGYGVSRDGTTVVGLQSLVAGTAFRWTQAGGHVPILGKCIAVRASGDGSVISGTDTQAGTDQAALWSAGAWSVKGGIGGQSGTSVSDFWDESNDGATLVGLGWVNAGTAHAIRWTQSGGMVDLGSSGASSRANGIAGDGSRIVGWDDHPSNGTRRPAYWLAPGAPVVMSSSPGEAQSVDLDGDVIVGAVSGEAFRWTTQNALVKLGVLTAGDTSSATDTDDLGTTLVGYSGPFGPLPVRRAFVWRPGLGLVNLQSLLAAQGVNVTGWTLHTAVGVSGDGNVITGYATRPGVGLGAFVATLDASAGSGTTYCTAKVNSLGCTPKIVSTGIARASAATGFVIGAADVLNNKSGLFFYSLAGQQASSFQGGTLCVKLPLKRTGIVSSGGSVAPTNDCSGTYGIEFNAYMASGADPSLVAGANVDGQFWSRDNGFSAPNNTGLTNAIHFVIQP